MPSQATKFDGGWAEFHRRRDAHSPCCGAVGLEGDDAPDPTAPLRADRVGDGRQALELVLI